ncbi:hypothetical protein NOCARDAX2BIS_400216 [Nocardioides sp. AX2bis]|nr:hypothetical protein NOCARDAX2BIS_400216 [Nocardioides sp. AX2bis]
MNQDKRRRFDSCPGSQPLLGRHRS